MHKCYLLTINTKGDISPAPELLIQITNNFVSRQINSSMILLEVGLSDSAKDVFDIISKNNTINVQFMLTLISEFYGNLFSTEDIEWYKKHFPTTNWVD